VQCAERRASGIPGQAQGADREHPIAARGPDLGHREAMLVLQPLELTEPAPHTIVAAVVAVQSVQPERVGVPAGQAGEHVVHGRGR
jgi:hypothetical protein